MTAPGLRPPIHPGQADTLVHFCGRARATASLEVANLTSAERLDSILREGRIRAYPPYGATWPVTCFSETDTGGLEALLTLGGFAPWGVVVRRDWVWEAGGGPVWYVREDAYDSVRSTLDERNQSWLVRTDPQSSDWLHEREWRVPAHSGAQPHLPLDAPFLVAILVGDPEWTPSPVDDMEMNPLTGNVAHIGRWPRLADAPRWYWDGVRINALQPIPARIEYYGDL